MSSFFLWKRSTGQWLLPVVRKFLHHSTQFRIGIIASLFSPLLYGLFGTPDSIGQAATFSFEVGMKSPTTRKEFVSLMVFTVPTQIFQKPSLVRIRPRGVTEIIEKEQFRTAVGLIESDLTVNALFRLVYSFLVFPLQPCIK